MKRPIFLNNHIYHIYNRGVEKRDTFMETRDYKRFISDLQEFNTIKQVLNHGRNMETPPLIEVGLQSRGSRKTLVEILAFCLMPNHFHLMIRQKTEHGITEFMRKLGTGYTNYFNLKNQRVGSLFQGKFKAILLNKEKYFIHLPHYIHINPLDLIPNKSLNRMEFLKKYQWSSLSDYLGIRKHYTFVNKNFVIGCAGGLKNFISSMGAWIDHPNRKNMRDILLD